MTKDKVSPKNHKNFKKQAGQILIIFLLILVVGLALVLSVASRSITDIRITTSTDESNRAYFAAEAGVEEALAQLQIDQDYPGGELNFTAINQTTAKVSVNDLDVSLVDAFEYPGEYARDSVVQVNLLVDFNTIGSGNPLDLVAPNQFAVYYGSESTGSVEPAIEVSIVHRSVAGVWGIKKFAFDSEVRLNGFCNVPAGTADVTTQNGDRTFSHLASFDFLDGYPAGCSGNPLVFDGIGTDTAVLARIRLLYNDVPEPVAVGTLGSFTLPVQGKEVISTGSTVSGVTRKIKVTNLFPSLPAIFDYVLFSGGDLEK